MVDPVPVAGNLLESKFLGLSVRRLGESMMIPIAPCLIGYTLGVPLLVTFPLFVVGIGVGVLIYARTPPGQRPLRYTHALVRHRTSGNVYVWAPSTILDDTLATGARQDEWLTRPPVRDSRSPHPVSETGHPGRPDEPGVRQRAGDRVEEAR
jgi:hypothetical protein